MLELIVHDVIDNDTVAALNLNGHRLPLPPESRPAGPRAARPAPETLAFRPDGQHDTMAVPGQEPARPIGATYPSLELRRHGIAPLASRNSARLTLATDLPASVLADFTGSSISDSTRWTRYAKRDRLDYIASRIDP
ncbi:hypothetical protein [Streptomyces sp. NPDC017529]|uniref:hypothetical protein n=1 Tax=Streptomyces sp. NPDC017529 TaxID=3365000 RepID=UPI00379C94DB